MGGTLNKNIKVIPFPGIENAYVVISGVKSERGNGCEKRMTFFYGTDRSGADWEPDYGAITYYEPCSGDVPGAVAHWFWEYCTGSGNWSQLAVDEEGLAGMFLEGDYVGLFGVLRKWAGS